MNHLSFPILSTLIFFPLLCAILLMFIRSEGGKNDELLRKIALVASVVEFLISLVLLKYFNDSTPGMQFVEFAPWVRSLSINYFVGLDGISLWLVIMTAFFVPLCVLCSWTYIKEKTKYFLISIFILESAMIGAFVSLDLILFYVFWEVMLIPMFLLIGVWGGERRIYSAVKFFLYTAAGSIFMLVAIIYLYYFSYKTTGAGTFNLLDLYKLNIPITTQLWLCAAFTVAFAIKVPIFPLHTWLPDAHVEAPTAGSVILAAILLKMGTYGFLRFSMPLFPYASHEFIPVIAFLAIAGIIYGALVAWAQPDMKKLVAYSSVSHLGFVMLGLFAFNIEGIEGGIYQMLNHGLNTGALFLLVGMIYERRHTRMMDDFGGLAKVMPVFAIFLMIATLGSVAVPGTNSFVGEIMILVGAFRAYPVCGVFAVSGMVLGAVYMLWMYQKVMFGPVTSEVNRKLPDLNKREIATMLPIAVLVFVMGIFPGMFLHKMDSSVKYFINQYQQKYEMYEAEKSGNPVATHLKGFKIAVDSDAAFHNGVYSRGR
ncbi:MAG: NADH-quinone oxidoreductase subunit M [Deltaproteobacteria bacterium]|jgi:NADH-quinone oxidoreductase subunit M|nr:NADH-quinone oxidoreductase subunit M [Deltaproteobacteria bacterium]